jgi:hypothetical protein
MSLDEHVDALAYDIAFWSVGVYSPDYPIDQLGNLALEVGDKLRAVAVMQLLGHASIDGFCHNLVRSARAWQTFLERAVADKATDQHHFCAGRLDPLLDAVAAGDFPRALQILALVPTVFRPGHEYEDDFCVAGLIGQLLGGRPDPAACAALFAQLDAYLGGDASPRRDLLAALLAGDAAAFGEVLEALLDEREAEIDAMKARGQLEDPAVLALRDVFVEGVAFLRLADALALPTGADYRMCPSIARLPMTRPFPGE